MKVHNNPHQLPVVTIGESLDLMFRLYNDQIASQTMHVLNMFGPSGQGKSAIVSQYGKFLAKHLGVEVVVYRLSLNQADPTDLKGIPFLEENKAFKVMRFAPPVDFPIESQPDTGRAPFTIIFLDEFNQAVPAMQNLGANLIDQVLGDHRIDLNRTQIILAGNLAADGAMVYEMPTNLATRVLSVLTVTKFTEWKTWAISSEVNPIILGFLEQFQESSFNSPDLITPGKSYPNPRTWTKLSIDLNQYPELKAWVGDNLSKAIAYGYLGPTLGSKFMAFAKNYSEGFDINQIIETGKDAFPNYDLENLYSAFTELAMRITRWIDDAKGENPQQTIQALKESGRVDSINNIYAWLSALEIGVPFKILLGKSIRPDAYRTLINVFYTDPAFESSKKVYDYFASKIV